MRFAQCCACCNTVSSIWLTDFCCALGRRLICSNCCCSLGVGPRLLLRVASSPISSSTVVPMALGNGVRDTYGTIWLRGRHAGRTPAKRFSFALRNRGETGVRVSFLHLVQVMSGNGVRDTYDTVFLRPICRPDIGKAPQLRFNLCPGLIRAPRKVSLTPFLEWGWRSELCRVHSIWK